MAQETRITLKSGWVASLTDGGANTAAEVRLELDDIADSAFILSTDTSDTLTEGSVKLLMTSAERTKLTGIETGATADQTTEEIQDASWLAVAAGTQTGITVTYQDVTNDVDFVVGGLGVGQFTSANISQWTNDSGYITATGGAFTGEINLQDNLLTRPQIKDYELTHTVPTIAAGAITFDYAISNSFNVSLTANITAITLSNPPVSGKYGEMVIELVQDITGGRTVVWPASVKWPGGTLPVITAAANSIDKVVLSTRDGGVTWLGDFSQAYA